VSKDSTVSALLETLNLVLSGNIYVPPQLLKKSGVEAWCKNAVGGIRDSNAGKYSLTTRQINILGYLSAGLSNKGIAEATNLAEGTVKTHIAAIYQILRVNNRIEAMQASKRLGLDVGAPTPGVEPESGKPLSCHASNGA
jgi:DNA-binding NarL/FixJ family response regulator